jgi:hypothetical protein
MGKVRTLAGVAALLTAGALSPHYRAVAQAQTPATLSSCSGTFVPSPMQGRYSGTWSSDALYHFQVFNTDLHLEIAIQGSLSAYVGSDGTVTGSATGTVNAPITHDGAQDVSSGYGTISGSVTGKLNPSGALLVLAHPVIDMHWGTFVAGGYTVEKFITMPDYSLAQGSSDCISAGGSISEQNFPVMQIIADGANETTYAPGIGVASGTWNLQSDKSSQFNALSTRVDSFIATSNALLNGISMPLSAGSTNRDIAAPLKSLVAEIQADPDTSRCLLERLAAWEAAAVTKLLHLNSAPVSSNLSALREAGDLVRSALELDTLCHLASTGVSDAVGSALSDAIDRSVSQRQWAALALLVRESIIIGVSVQTRVAADLHGLLSGSKGSAAMLELARVSYALGDDADSATAAARLTALAKLGSPLQHRKPQKKKKPTNKPKPTPTATPKPKATLRQILTGHLTPVALAISGDQSTWTPVPGASSYVVTAKTSSGLAWSWSGTQTSAHVGDTSLDGVASSADDLPPQVDLSGAQWTVLALGAQGRVVGGTFRKGS